MTPALQDRFLATAVAAFDRQLALADLVGDLDWHVDVPEARLAFGDRFRWAVQFLGTESHVNGTWLWAWANPSGLPRHGLYSAGFLRDIGVREDVPEFSRASSPLTEADGHSLALVASGLRSANAYYRCPYDGGALFVLIQDLSFPRTECDPIERITTVFPQALTTLPLADHRLAWTGYLASYGLTVLADGNSFVTVRDGVEVEVLRATFDEQNRLTQLGG